MCGWRHLFKMKIIAILLLCAITGCADNGDSVKIESQWDGGTTLTIITNKGHIFAVLHGGRGCALVEIKEDK